MLKAIMKRLLASLLALTAVLVTPSCLEYETNITLNQDGSGTITEETVFNAQIIGMLEMTALQGGQGNGGQAKSPLNALKDPEKAKAKAKDYGEGVTFVKIEEIARNGGKGVRVTYKFADINKVSINPGEGLTNLTPSPATEAKEVGTATTFTFADNKLSIISPDVDTEKARNTADDLEIPDPPDPQAAQMMQMLKGMKMTSKITAAPGIANTDATFQSGDTITLYEMDLDKILANPEGLNAMKGIDMSDRTKAAAALSKIKGVKAETKEKVTVELISDEPK
mgnify:FL=1